MRVVDAVMALPALVLALTIAAVLGPGIWNATVAIAVVAAPTYTRLVRGQVLSIKENDYVLAAQSIGAPTWVILMRHILPNAFSPVIVQASLGVGFAIILEASLSFIGLGAQPPTPIVGQHGAGRVSVSGDCPVVRPHSRGRDLPRGAGVQHARGRAARHPGPEVA